MSTQDIIKPIDVLRKAPAVLKKLPKMAYGLALGSSTNPTKVGGLGWALEKATKANPYGSALLYKDTQLNYLQFNQWVNRIAHYFLAQGLKKGDVVAIFIENRPELLAAVGGLAKIGVTCALLNTSQTGKVLTHSFNLVKPKMAIVGDELVNAFNDVRADLVVGADKTYWFADTDTLKDAGAAPANFRNLALEIQNSPSYNPPTTSQVYYSDGLFYIYTSGTTGMPKAAIFSHGRWMKAYGIFGSVMDLNHSDIMYVTLPFYHATAMAVCYGAILYGGAGVAMRRKFSAREFWDDIRKYNASAIGYVGELCRYLMEVPAKPEDKAHRVRKMVGNGMRANIWTPFKQRFGVEEVYELYGSSEGNIGFNNIFNFDNTVGFCPLPYAIVKYDKENDKPVRDANGFMVKAAKGEAGLLIGKITERTPFDGYTDPAKNESCILKDVFEKGDRYFNTGDLVRDIGFRHAQFVDRLGDTFRWKGENVSTTEVENLMCSYPALAEAVVYGVEIPNTNGRAGMAAITPHEGMTIDYSGLLEHLRKEMPAYAIPVFLRLQQKMETTGTFKYQKNNLKKDSFDINATHGEPLFVWLPGTNSYQAITPEIWENIHKGTYRF
ncbi:long-chain-acyl-CoA synthetase [Agitococcus lubricus]|uniref:Citronellyl-CoA synthetase n=1 Tax=Agitococcus lubricus TaxID=1077255 RepID=A0A2T5J0D4_9GAMM|nr:long-chain-acyl-CoA synthetase [Agitococcus lubricus]PTQ89787.1 citronellyl-CoA synthetase [Agitococcus lubricus]